MTQVPPPPPLERQTAVPLGSTPTWWKATYEQALSQWQNAANVFPEYFRGDLVILAVRVTPQVLADITQHDPDQSHSRYYIGDFVGKVIRHVGEHADDIYPGDVLYTPMSYYSYSAAIYEASLLSMDSTRSVVRHILYTIAPLETFPHYPSIEMMSHCVLTKGLYPSEANVRDDSDSDREPEWSLHLPE